MRVPFLFLLSAAGRAGRLAVVLAAAAAAWPAAAAAQDEVVRRGAPIGASPVVDLDRALRSVDAWTGTTVTIDGRVARVCRMKGCWMELRSDDAARGIRVTFKDYAFFVPTDADGAAARVEGTFERNVFSKREADHLIGEGASLTRNPDGTATEIAFVAQAVELRR